MVAITPRFPVLDSLRAVGAMAVLTTHVAFQAGAYTEHGVWGTLLARLDVGVAIFFVLSGFLLSRPFLARAAAGHPMPATGRYLWKRFVRIYPVYVVTVVIALVAIPENRGTGPAGWLSTLLLADVYTADRLPHGLTQMWSLSAEVAFYLALPLLMRLAVGRDGPLRPVRVWGLVIAMTLVATAWHLGPAAAVAEVSPGTPATWFPAYLTWFAAGIALALVHVLGDIDGAGRLSRTVAACGHMPGTCWAVVAGLLLVAATPIAGPTLLFVGASGEMLAKHFLYAAIGAVVVLTGAFTGGGRYERVMSSVPLRHLGHISYGTFCIHLPLLYLAWEVTGYPLFEGHGLQIWVITVVLSLAASEALYRFVELPAMRLKGGKGLDSGDSSSAPISKATASTTR